MHIYALNVRSIVNEIDHIRELFVNFGVNLILISVTWLTNQVDDVLIDIPGFNFYRQNRLRSRGGGLLTYYIN